MRKAKVLVTGGAGFIGSHLVDRLITDGHEVVVLDNLSTGKRDNLNSKAKLIECDIADFTVIEKHFAEVEVVFHLAALARIQPSIKDPLPANHTNVTGTLNVLWAAKKHGVTKVIYSGSSSAYGLQPTENFPLKETLPTHPSSPYALQKLVGEQYCQLFSSLYGLPTVIFRYFNVYGPRQLTEGSYATVIGIFLKQTREGRPMTIVGDGKQRRDFTHVSDIVEANILAWQKVIPPGEVINLGTGKNYSINEIAQLIGGPDIHITERLGEYPITQADNSKARKLLGWQPKISLEQGILDLKGLPSPGII